MTAGIHSLSNEILRDILDHIDADPERSMSIDRRAYLSVESFRPPDPPPPPRAQDVANFRLTCRRFAELGVSHQFTRIATRFSYRGLQRLEWIANQKHLARHTKKFSYLIPNFYVEGRTRIRDLLDDADGELQLDPASLEAKIEVQLRITQSGEDGRILKKAMRAFTSLQHVQILRLQDQADSALIDYLHENIHHSETVDLSWPPACTHASQTIADALAEANSPVTRLSGPMMNPQSVFDLMDRAGTSFLPLGEKLTCLELHFDDAFDLRNRMSRLSEVFHVCFRAAKNMQAVHLGFPSRAPLDLPLETVFNNVRWDKLRAFGVQAWRLHADEILSFARRHRRSLRGLRLRDVLLRNGSMWKDVLAALREEMEQLEWVSLRRIDYEVSFDALWSGSIQIPTGWPPLLASDSEESDEDGFHHVNLSDGSLATDSEVHHEGDSDHGNDSDDNHDDDDDDESDDNSNSGGDDDDDDGSYVDSEIASVADSDEGPDSNELALAPDLHVTLPACTCEKGRGLPATADELGDNGRSVVYQQRKLWEKWVVGRCLEHGKGEELQ